MHTTHLILDLGNTHIKAGLFQGDVLLKWARLPGRDMSAVAHFLNGERPNAIGSGSVAMDDPGLMEALTAIAPVHVIKGDSPSPCPSRIPDRTTLGVDRLANAVGAARLMPGRAVLVIDPGTAITYDLVEPDGTHAGGAISPGKDMRARAMNNYSARLPLVDTATPATEWTGTGTENALRAGIHFGITAEMDGFIRRARHQWPELAVVLTGGDAIRYMNALKNGIFAVPLLTLDGLHALLVHQLSVSRTTGTPGTHRTAGPRATG